MLRSSHPKTEIPLETEDQEIENKDQEFTPKPGDNIWAWTTLVDDIDAGDQWVAGQYLQREPDGERHMVNVNGTGYYVWHVQLMEFDAAARAAFRQVVPHE